MRSRILLVSGMVVWLSTTAFAAQDKIPPFAEVEKTVSAYFEADPEFQSDDLICREGVLPLVTKLRKQWLPSNDADQILKRIPSKDEFLVRQLSTPDGRKFMRKISGYPGGYDRVDRLSRMPHGEQTIRDLVRGPGGERMIEYMTLAPGGKELGGLLSNAPTGKDFNAPTGRIYTASMLLDELQKCHTALTKKAQAPKKR